MDSNREQNDQTPYPELERIRKLVIRLLIGMILLAICLLICWIAFGKVSAAPAIASAAIIVFLFYSARIWLLWKKEPLEEHLEEPVKTNAVKNNKAAAPQNNAESAHKDPERVVYRAHWAFFLKLAFRPLLIFLGLLILLFIGISEKWEIMSYPETIPLIIVIMAGMFLWILFALFDWINDLYIVEADSVKDINKKPFTKKDINIAMMGKIQSVRFRKKGPIQLLLNFGTLIIVVGESELDFNYVPQPEKVQQLILDRVEEYEQRQKQSEIDKQQYFINELVTALKQTNNKSE
jgi:hypothetical protein